MEYERLTDKKYLNKPKCFNCEHNYSNCPTCERHCVDGDHFRLREELQRLVELEDKIENGTLKEVVRCKDCKCLEELHYEEVGEKPYIKRVCKLFKRQMQLNDFCSYGLLKEKEDGR